MALLLLTDHDAEPGQFRAQLRRVILAVVALAQRPRAGLEERVGARREIQRVLVASLVGTGATNAEIARTLYISEGTARNQISKILKKLGLRDRTRLAVYATERGWTKRSPEITNPDLRRPLPRPDRRPSAPTPPKANAFTRPPPDP